MSLITLQRDDTLGLPQSTGRLYLPTVVLHTLEHPWRPTAPGGRPFDSCVPAGIYRLRRHTRPKTGDQVVALVNHGLGVYYLPDDKPSGVGRDLILIHKANWLKDIEGCIAPGLGVSESSINGYMVTDSAKAMTALMTYVESTTDELYLEIRGSNRCE